jgi:hypothetical protein
VIFGFLTFIRHFSIDRRHSLCCDAVFSSRLEKGILVLQDATSAVRDCDIVRDIGGSSIRAITTALFMLRIALCAMAVVAA